MQYTAYVAPHTGKPYKNYMIRGPCASGEIKMKTRGRAEAFTARHGEIEPLAYLHCWLMKYDSTVEQASRLQFEPSNDEIDAFVAAHRQGLLDVFHRLVTD